MYHSVAPKNELRHFADQDIILAVNLYMHCDKGTAHGDPGRFYGKEDTKVCTYGPFKIHAPTIIFVTL